MGDTMTKEQLLEETIKMMTNINVPAGLTTQVAIPLWNAINNIRVVVQMLSHEKQVADKPEENALKEPEEETETEDKPE